MCGTRAKRRNLFGYLAAEMDEKAEMESKLSSAAAFVEGGVQDACDDACSICLDAFCDSNPSTVRTSAAAAKYFGCLSVLTDALIGPFMFVGAAVFFADDQLQA